MPYMYEVLNELEGQSINIDFKDTIGIGESTVCFKVNESEVEILTLEIFKQSLLEAVGVKTSKALKLTEGTEIYNFFAEKLIYIENNEFSMIAESFFRMLKTEKVTIIYESSNDIIKAINKLWVEAVGDRLTPSAMDFKIKHAVEEHCLALRKIYHNGDLGDLDMKDFFFDLHEDQFMRNKEGKVLCIDAIYS